MASNKFCLIVEGEIESRLAIWLKTNFLKCKTKTICKAHKIDNCHGTIPIKKIKDNKCCKQIILKDTDDIDPKIYEDKRTQNNIIILSSPSIEIVLYAIFNCTDSELVTNDIEKKLNEKLKVYNIKYNHDISSLNKILKLLENNKELSDEWLKNLKKLHYSKKSNFYELVKYFSTKNEKEAD